MGLGIFALIVAVFGTPAYCIKDSFISSCKKEKIAAANKWLLSNKTWDDFYEARDEEIRLRKKYGDRHYDKC